MDERALILFYLFAAANSHVYFDNRHPGHVFPNIPHMINDMFNAHRNMMLGNSYNQHQGMSGLNPIDNGMNVGQNNIGYQRPLQSSGLDNLNNQPLQDNFSDSSDSAEGLSTGKQTYIDKETTTTPLPNTLEPPKETLRLSTDNPHYLSNSSKLPIDSDTDTAQSSNTKRSTHSLTNNNNKPEINKNEAISNKKPEEEHHELNTNKDTDKEPLLNKNMELEKESLKVNKPRDPNAIVFPDNEDEVKKEAHQIHKGNASELPNKFNDTPQILYAVNIAPSGSNHWGSGSNTSPLINAVTSQQLQNTQTPPLTNSQSYTQNNQYSNRPTYTTLHSSNQAPVTSLMADATSFGNSIVLPNPSGGSTLYTIVNLPNTANANVPSQLYQTSNAISNPSNYQQQTSVPTVNSGIIKGMPTYYVVSLPNKQTPQQNIQASLPYTNAPVKYSVGYISSNGQTVLVPSTPVVYQLIPQNLVPVSNNQGNVPQNTYVPVSNVQASVVSEPVSNSQGNVVSPQTSYVSVSNGQANTGNTQITYVPVSNGQGNTADTQINYLPVSNGEGNADNAQIHYVPVSNSQENAGNTLINYVPVSNGQENTANPQTNYVSVSNGQGNTDDPQNYVQLTSDQGNVVTLTSSPSGTVLLPPNTETVTLLSFKDKTEEKPKKKKKRV